MFSGEESIGKIDRNQYLNHPQNYYIPSDTDVAHVLVMMMQLIMLSKMTDPGPLDLVM